MVSRSTPQVFLITFLLVFPLYVSAEGLYTGKNGKGTAVNPFKISTVSHWEEFEANTRYMGSHYRLMADLDFDNLTRTPVGTLENPFVGNFDGQNHTLKNISLDTAVTNGLFGTIGFTGQVSNLHLQNVSAYGGALVGALAGLLENGTVQGCSVRNLSLHGTRVGGLIGNVRRSVLENSTAEGVVWGNDCAGVLVGAITLESQVRGCTTGAGKASGLLQTGGLAGICEDSTIEDCLSFANAEATNFVGGLVGRVTNSHIGRSEGQSICSATDDVGGLVGVMENGSRIESCSVTGTVSSLGSNAGGLAGRVEDSLIDSVTTDVTVQGNSNTGGLAGFTSQASIHECTVSGETRGEDRTGGLIGWAVDSTIDEVEVYGEVRGKNSTGGLVGFSQNSHLRSSEATENIHGGEFHTGGLMGLMQSSTADSCNAFGNVAGSRVTGGLAGAMEDGCVILNCQAWGTVFGSTQTGGLVGEMFSSQIMNCEASGDVTGSYQTGGLVGHSGDDVPLARQSLFSVVTARGAVQGEEETGGLIGNMAGGMAQITTAHGDVVGSVLTGGLIGLMGGGTVEYGDVRSTVKGNDETGGIAGRNEAAMDNIYFEGTVTGENLTGGLAGLSKGNITHGISTGTVQGNTFVGGIAGRAQQNIIELSYSMSKVYGDYSVGGIVGMLFDATAMNCYAQGHVQGNHFVGGLVGIHQGSLMRSYAACSMQTGITAGGLVAGGDPASITDCYWDRERSGISQDISGFGNTTAELRDMHSEEVYTHWDFEDVWAFPEDFYQNLGYPYLRDLQPPVDQYRWHPADMDRNGTIDEEEADHYTKQWQEGAAPMENAIRARYLLEHNGAYIFDAHAFPPECWLPAALVIL